MMGKQAAPAQLFYDFSLDEHVPADHLLRRIDNHLDLDGVRAQLKPYYSSTGRPSIHPELMMRMLIIGYSMGIRSERNCARRFISISPIVCFAGLDWSARCRIIPASRRTAMDVFGKAISFGICSRRWLSAASYRVLSVLKALPSMPA